MSNEAVTQVCFKALSDPIRRSLLALLGQGPRTVNELVAQFDVSRPAISRHLRVLRESELVRETRTGRQRTYSLVPEALGTVVDWLRAVEKGTGERPVRSAVRLSRPAAVSPGGWRQW